MAGRPQAAFAQDTYWINSICEKDPISLSLSGDLESYAGKHGWKKLYDGEPCESVLDRLATGLPPAVAGAELFVAADLHRAAAVRGVSNLTIRNANLVAFPVYLYSKAGTELPRQGLRVGYREQRVAPFAGDSLNHVLNEIGYSAVVVERYGSLWDLAQALHNGAVNMVAVGADVDPNSALAFTREYAKAYKQEPKLLPAVGPKYSMNETSLTATPFLMVELKETLPKELQTGVADADGVVAFLRPEWNDEMAPTPRSLWQQVVNAFSTKVYAEDGRRVPHRFPVLLASSRRGAASSQDFRQYLAASYLRAIAKASMGARHACEGGEAQARPLLLAYLVAALAEQPEDRLLNATLRSNLKILAVPLPEGASSRSSGDRATVQTTFAPGDVRELAALLRKVGGNAECRVERAVAFQKKDKPGLAEYQVALKHVQTALSGSQLSQADLRSAAACLVRVVELFKNIEEPKCQAFDRGMWFTYYEPMLPTAVVLRTLSVPSRPPD